MTTSSRQSSSTSMVNNLAKIFDPNALQNQGPDNGMDPPQILHVASSDDSTSESFNITDMKFASLEQKMDKLLTLQDNVLKKLNSISQEICCIEKDIEIVKAERSGTGPRMERNKNLRSNEMKRLCLKMQKSLSDINRNAERQVKRLDGLEQSVFGLQKFVGPLVEKVKTLVIHNSSVKHHGQKRKLCKAGDYTKEAGHLFRMHVFSETTAAALLKKKSEKLIKEKLHLNETGTKEKPPDSTEGAIQKSQSCSQEEEVDKLNKENADTESSVLLQMDPPKFHTEGSEKKGESLAFESCCKYRRSSVQKSFTTEKQEEDAVGDACQRIAGREIESESPGDGERKEEQQVSGDERQEKRENEGEGNADKSEKEVEEPPAPFQNEGEAGQSHDEEAPEGRCKGCEKDGSPTPPAPFDHRIVSAKRVGISSYYNVSENEILGGGRFGQVHKCEEKATGLKLAAKIIKAKGPKQKDEVKNEINVMNQLNHVNLIQLYDAFESKNDIVLVMEYVEGGELFDRIIDENCNLTEMDTILFIKHICEGIQYMHQMYILHLDLKPENILCVNRAANQIKIIDFGLARRYQPREKLRVNFGTPEFLAPEVVNYEFVSFPTDMWSVGVIAYMLLSGLSPFLGEDDNETLNNILSCSWDFEDEEFRGVSDQAKDFISKLLIKEKCWRISATAALKHPWLSDHKLHCRLQKKAKGDSVSQAPPAQ
ncbi:myosin light chain kinase family member 4 isoform X3 [Rissa tridactyla]|uniref:myosin light chain kinase family member 4 isoform X3 n=1 Tax=Rissa tridactyla TaxID=75485 RepID=UPI0023BA7ED9|nr:myosin light chain kinase family member 4 isoform X3 [Rissa tridactyla]